ncbi:MAG: SLBB domain-containing protein, partial [Oscillospiraceae bacterium]
MTLLEKIKNAGVIGAGGAGFPTHVKLDSKPEIIIINGAECEPLLRVDQQLMAVYADELADALEAVRAELGAGKAIFALKGKYHSAFDALLKAVKKHDKLSVFELDNFYPAGDEQITIYEVTGRIVPEGSIPIAVGVVVMNVETLLNISKAMKDITVTEKYITVAGAVANPTTFKVPLGVSYRELITLAGGATVKDPVLIDGGPMMGKFTEDLDRPVTKTSKGIIVLSRNHPWIQDKCRPIESMMRQARTCCCHCSLCTEVCPRNLIGHGISPDKLMRITTYGSMCTNNESITSAFLCSECGACEIACVMGLQPFKLNNLLKAQLSQNGIKNPHKNKPEAARPFRENKKMSIGNILSRTRLTEYDVPAPLKENVDIRPTKVSL